MGEVDRVGSVGKEFGNRCQLGDGGGSRRDDELLRAQVRDGDASDGRRQHVGAEKNYGSNGEKTNKDRSLPGLGPAVPCLALARLSSAARLGSARVGPAGADTPGTKAAGLVGGRIRHGVEGVGKPLSYLGERCSLELAGSAEDTGVRLAGLPGWLP